MRVTYDFNTWTRFNFLLDVILMYLHKICLDAENIIFQFYSNDEKQIIKQIMYL